MNLKIVILSCICFLSFEAASQTVHLSRLQRASGDGYIPYTNASGKPVYTLAANVFEFGSGTTGRIAAWSSDTLRSYIWEINDTYIRGSGTGWPQIENGQYGFRGDSDTYIARVGSDEIQILAGSANAIMRMTGGVVNINPALSSTEYWQFQNGLFATTIATGPRLNTTSLSSPQYSFSGDINTGMSNKSADNLTFHAGDNTNESMKIDGVADLITFDPNDDGTDDVTISSTKTSIAGGLNIGVYTSSPTSSALLGRADNNDVSSITVGTGLSLSSNTLTATATTLTAGTNIVIAGDSISADIKWPHWDGGVSYTSSGVRQALTTTIDTCQWRNSVGTMVMDVHISNGISFDSLSWSTFPGWIFDEGGTYEVSYQFIEDGSDSATNREGRMEWYINGTGFDPFGNNYIRSYYNETSTRSHVANGFQLTVGAGQMLQMGQKLNTGTSDMDMESFRVQIKKIRD